jgi:hypothetical protein
MASPYILDDEEEDFYDDEYGPFPEQLSEEDFWELAAQKGEDSQPQEWEIPAYVRQPGGGAAQFWEDEYGGAPDASEIARATQMGQHSLWPSKGLLPLSKLALTPEQVEAGMEWMSEPFLSEEDRRALQEMPFKAGPFAKATSGVTQGLWGTAESLTSPINLGLLVGTAGLSEVPVAARLLSGAFAADMARHVPEMAREAGEAYESGDTERFARALTELGATGTFTTMAGTHAAVGPRELAATTGRPDAIQEPSATAFYGRLQEQPRIDEGTLPAQEGAAGVPQRELPTAGNAQRPFSAEEAGGRHLPLIEQAAARNAELGLPSGWREAQPHETEGAGWIATVDEGGRTVINTGKLNTWLERLPPEDQAGAIQAIFSEEGIHGVARKTLTDDSVGELWKSLSRPEQKLVEESYGKLDPQAIKQGVSPEVMYGHEYLRRQMQRMLREPVREKAEARGYDWLKESAIDAIERVIIAGRRLFGSKASKNLDSMLNRMAEHIDAARKAKGMEPANWAATLEKGEPAARPRAMEKEAAEAEKERPPLIPALQGKSFSDTVAAYDAAPPSAGAGYRGKNGPGPTGLAWDIGSMAKTAEDVAALRKMAEDAPAKMKQLMDAGDFDGAMQLAGKQPAEAYEFATGVKIDGTPKWDMFERSVPGYKPAVPDPKYLKAKGAPRAMAKEEPEFRPRHVGEHPADYDLAKRRFLEEEHGIMEPEYYGTAQEQRDIIRAVRRQLAENPSPQRRQILTAQLNEAQAALGDMGGTGGAPRATLKEKAQDTRDKFVELKNKVANAFGTRGAKQISAATKDAADNQARIMSDQARNGLILEAKKGFGENSEQALKAIVAVIESGGDKTQLQKFIAQATGKRGGEEAAAAARFADANWDRMQPLVDRFREETNKQRDMEVGAGLNVEERQNYYPHLFDVNKLPNRGAEFFGGRSGGGGSGRFQAQRTFNTIYDAIEAGYGRAIKSLNAADVLQNRINSGTQKVMDRAWVDSLRNLNDPTTGIPIVASVRIDPNGVMLAPPGYEIKTVLNGPPTAVHKGYSKFIDSLTGGSAVEALEVMGLPVGEFALKTEAAIKHGTLLFDTFHASRIMQKANFLAPKQFAGQLLNPKTFGKKGVSLLEYSDRDLSQAVRQGDITPEIQRWIRANRPNANLLIGRGLNVGQVHEALRADLVKVIPGIGPFLRGFNGWVFQKVTRGALMESGLVELDRIQRANPTWSREQVADKVVKDLNTYFGNLGRQGVFKSKTFQDLSRLILLAPNWFESMARSEIYGYGQLGKAAFHTVTGEPKLGTIGKGMAGGLFAYFVATQLINLATRHQPTWQNEEEGHKMDAWIPDVTGKSPGFFLSPMGVPAEITHDFLRYRQKRFDDSVEGAMQIAKNKMSPLMRAAWTLSTGETYKGRVTGSWNRAKAAAISLIPVPIAVGGLTSDRPGATQRQVTSTLGFKTEHAETHQQQIRDLYSRWAANNPDPKVRADFERERGAILPVSKYRDLDRALDLRDKDKILEAIEAVRPLVRKDADIKARMRPFSGEGYKSTTKPLFGESKELEKKFLSELTDKQKELYDKAVEDRRERWLQFLEVWPERGDPPERRPGVEEEAPIGR